MSIFLEISGYYGNADASFAVAEQQAFLTNDDVAFDAAGKARKCNDQAYFLYLFTRLEAEVDAAVGKLLAARTGSSISRSDRRVWQAWSRSQIQDIALLSKVEVLTDKGRTDYAQIKQYYDERNKIAHGGVWQSQFYIPNVAQTMTDIVTQFTVT